MKNDMKLLWGAACRRQPESVVMPCRCGAMPAPITNVSGLEQRRCWPCYETDLAGMTDHWRD